MSKSNGTGWRYRCKSCNFEVGIDKAFPDKCPGCNAAGWWGHLVTPVISQSEVTMSPGGIKTRDRILSQLPDATEGRGRGRPHQPVPGDLIKELARQGFSSRAIAKDLAQRGFRVSYKTVQRVLSSERQGSLL